MIYRLTNPEEVEQGIQEAAYAKGLTDPDLRALEHEEAFFAAMHGVSAVLRKDGKITPPCPEGKSKWELLEHYYTRRLLALWWESYAEGCGTAAEAEAYSRRWQKVLAVMCSKCGRDHRDGGMLVIADTEEPGSAFVHFEPKEDHDFVCPHGEDVDPETCVLDHQDVPTKGQGQK